MRLDFVALAVGVINILIAAGGKPHAWINFLVGLVFLFTAAGGFGPFEDKK